MREIIEYVASQAREAIIRQEDGGQAFKPPLTTTRRASLVAQTVKNLPAVWETWVRSLGWEDPLENGKKGKATLQYSGLGEFLGL